MSGSSSNRRRRPCRNRTWSCASRQRIFLLEKITSCESVRGGTQFSFVWPENLKNHADEQAELRPRKNMNVRYCSNHLRSCAYENLPGSAFSCHPMRKMRLLSLLGNSRATLHQVKSSTYAALLHCRRISRRSSGRFPFRPSRGT